MENQQERINKFMSLMTEASQATGITYAVERIYTLRDLGYDPYVMIYDKEHTKGNDPVRLLQRYVNNRRIFRTISRFEDYDPKKG